MNIESIKQCIEKIEKELVELKVYVNEINIEKTPNQLRAELIEKAKGFVDVLTKQVGESNYRPKTIYGFIGNKVNKWVYNVDFVVNEQKRTIVTLLRGRGSNSVFDRGIAKCNPSDVFNEHIGKAIALGRALGLDVSEFEQAVQPTFAMGQIVENRSKIENPFLTTPFIVWKVDDEDIYEDSCSWTPIKYLTIIDDTNAIYEGLVK